MSPPAGRRLSTVLAVLTLFLAAAGLAPAAAEEIRDFAVEVRIDPDGGLEVVEDIAYDFQGRQRHGIYREIPVRYERSWGEAYRVDLDVVSVTDANGAPRPHRVEREGARVRIRIGSPDRKLGGAQHYRIRYRAEGALLFFDGHDELYWNLTGNEWRIPIRAARARVVLPRGVAATRTRCFSGSVGSQDSDCRVQEGASAVAFEATRGLGPGEGLTAVVGLPKGAVAEPGPLARLWRRLRGLGGAWLLSPLVAVVGMLGLWRAHGRDPRVSAAVVVRYEAPGGLTPAEVGALVDERVDVDDVTATVLDLAVRGHLRIREVAAEGFLFLSDRDYQLERLTPPGGGEALRPHERRMLEALFRDGPEVNLASLKNRFYEDLAPIIEAIEEGLTGAEHHFVRSPSKVRAFWRGAAGVVLAGALFAGFQGALRPGAVGALVVSAAVVFLFARVMPRKTRLGREVHEQILGFREFLTRVERDRLERDGRRDTGTFERILPYAQVLGVADPWAEVFADLYTRPPDWYVTSGNGDFVPRRFVADVGRALETVGRTVTSRPSGQTGGAGGGFSGFGGGGFSGGGFGGGGGGSW